ncbi:jg26587 [Pararge aegeria aegeria]|uniref:Jg26587 protein n=1 Tax=Pararge aegeria aegeria TaxID=348720 RepID=A0A8S4QWH7_9NEOP|nr:jg26587 [Pararge aegeria aegeria]
MSDQADAYKQNSTSQGMQGASPATCRPVTIELYGSYGDTLDRNNGKIINAKVSAVDFKGISRVRSPEGTMMNDVTKKLIRERRPITQAVGENGDEDDDDDDDDS